MKLHDLVAGLPISGDCEARVEVREITHDSRRVEPGSLFVALVGDRFDATRFVPDVIERGAIAVLAEGPPDSETSLPWLVAPEARRLMATLAARIYDHPDRELDLVGVTGTNGKSTVVWLLEQVLTAAGRPAGRLGTLASRFGNLEEPATRTTPESTDLFRLMRTWRDAGAQAIAMEVSSHALARHRVEGLAFRVAVFTNLTQDHLDFHRDLEDYFQTKSRLFDQLTDEGRAVIHVGDPWGRRLAKSLPDAITVGPRGDVQIAESKLTLEGTWARITTPRGDLEIESQLLGAYNLENLCTVVGVGEALGLDHRDIRQGIAATPVVPGRMERVGEGSRCPIFVDFAHTPEALAATLSAVRSLSQRRVAVVFGCGGDKDRSKRPVMGRVAGELADLPIVTSDNPRSEDPIAILAAVEEGLVASGNRSYRLLPDRRDAIRRALDVVDESWVLVVAGKGHETGQEAGGVVRPFSDRQEILRALEEHHGVSNGS